MASPADTVLPMTCGTAYGVILWAPLARSVSSAAANGNSAPVPEPTIKPVWGREISRSPSCAWAMALRIA